MLLKGLLNTIFCKIAFSLSLYLSVSLSHRMFPFCILSEPRMKKVVVTTGAIRHAKLPSKHHHQQTNTQIFTRRTPFLSHNQQCQSSERWRESVQQHTVTSKQIAN